MSAKRRVLFMDLDGTLIPLRNRPDAVKLNLSLRRLLRRLAQQKGLTFYIISGRPRAELRKLVPVPGVRLLGVFGWDGRAHSCLATEREMLRKAKRMFGEQLPHSHGLWLQDKDLGLAIHFRGATPNAVRTGRRVVARVLESVKPHIRLLEGKGIWELLPRQIDGKGPAVGALVAKYAKSTLPIFVGDDATDESAFAIIPRGLSIHVGRRRRTNARFYLRNPSEVRLFLERLEAIIN